VRIVLDGINSYEELAIIHNRIKVLPAELDDLFTHILTKRIPLHCKTMASRCLLIMLIWKQL